MVLSNVDIVSEGFDVPDCEAVQLARPTKSLALYLQQVGRCMRPAPKKTEGLVSNGLLRVLRERRFDYTSSHTGISIPLYTTTKLFANYLVGKIKIITVFRRR